jgi:haloacetate dehalogenase
MAIWKEYCSDQVELTGTTLECGHYIAEEKPEELLVEIDGYFD